MALQGKGIVEFRDDLTLEEVKEDFSWLLEADFVGAIIGYIEFSGVRQLVWYNGIWYTGIWVTGTWRNGKWVNGIWKNGMWDKGIWKDGKWKDGVWFGG